MVLAISLCKTGFHSFLYLNDTPLTIIPYFLYLLACWSASRSVLSLSCIIIRYLNIHRSAEAFSTCPAGGPTCTHFSSVIQAQVAQWWSICFSHPGPGLYPNAGGGRGNSSQVIWHMSVILECRRLRQEEQDLEIRLKSKTLYKKNKQKLGLLSLRFTICCLVLKEISKENNEFT